MCQKPPSLLPFYSSHPPTWAKVLVRIPEGSSRGPGGPEQSLTLCVFAHSRRCVAGASQSGRSASVSRPTSSRDGPRLLKTSWRSVGTGRGKGSQAQGSSLGTQVPLVVGTPVGSSPEGFFVRMCGGIAQSTPRLDMAGPLSHLSHHPPHGGSSES